MIGRVQDVLSGAIVLLQRDDLGGRIVLFEIKDILAYLKLIANPSDGISLRRIINIPPRGVGEKTVERISGFSREKGMSLYQGLEQAVREESLPPLVRKRLQEFIDLMEELRRDARAVTLSQLTLALLDKTGYLRQLKEEGTDEAFSRVENIEELINVIMELEKSGEEATLETFLDKVSLVTDIDSYQDKGNRISLMTLHCAKGLEFPFVFIIGIEEGLLPHYRRGEEVEDMEEERRLFYVGITRAKERLFLSRAERRSTFGVGRANLPSRFLDELPTELIFQEEKPGKMENLFFGEASWSRSFDPVSGEKEDVAQEGLLPTAEREVSLLPEGFYPLRIGMRVRHPKFGEGRVTSVEGMDEEQKATIGFATVGPKRLKVRHATLEILE